MSDKKSQGKGSKLPQRKRAAPTNGRKARSARSVRGRPSGPSLANPAKRMMHPMSMNSGRRSKNDSASCRIHGTDFLTAVTIGGTNAAAGDVLISQVVNPAQLGVSRLATMAKLYERYKFRSLKFRYAPVANAQVTGQLIGYVDYDTYDDPTGISGVQNLQRAAAHYGEKPVQVWQGSEKPVFWEIKDVDPMTDLYVDSDGSDPRWTNQGRFVLLAASAIASGVPCGNIYLDYDIEFFIPQLEETPSTGYGSMWLGATSMTAANPFGTAPTQKTWNNLPVSLSSASVFTLKQGTYIVTFSLTGTVITAESITPSSGITATVFDSGYKIPTDQKSLLHTVQYTVPQGGGTLTYSVTATTVTAATASFSLAPSNAVTLTARKLANIARLLRMVGDVDRLQGDVRLLQSVSADTGRVTVDSKESRETVDLHEVVSNMQMNRETFSGSGYIRVSEDDRGRAQSSSSMSSSMASSPKDYVMVRKS